MKMIRFSDVVNGEMALKNEFYPALSDSSSKDFKDLALQFCGAVSILLLH